MGSSSKLGEPGVLPVQERGAPLGTGCSGSQPMARYGVAGTGAQSVLSTLYTQGDWGRAEVTC